MRNKDSCNRYAVSWGESLSSTAPCGEDCSFSTEFEALRTEVGKSTDLHATADTDWSLVLRLATDFLQTQSKDLWALVYAVYAEYRVNGLDTCPSTFSALTHILSTFWDDLYPLPTRMQRRLAPLVWLCGRMEHHAEATHFMDGSPESVSSLRNEFSALQALLEEKSGDAAPSFPGIFAKIQDTTQEPSTPESSSPQPASSQTPTQPITASLAAMDKDGRIPAGILPQVTRTTIDNTRQLAGHFLSLNPKDERGYRLHRVALWDTLTQLPQADATGKTSLTRGIPPDRVQAYVSAVDGKQYAEILPYLERSASKSPFWFDGHAMVVRCLEGLDAPTAAACVRESLAALLRRFPELLSYKFSDNTPFASPKNLPWLETIRTADSAGKTTSVAYAGISGSEGSDEETLLQKAVALGSEENFQAGLRHLGRVSAGRSRAAVLHAILQARYCLALGKKESAEHLLSALYQQMEQWDLLDWEPELTARVLTLLLSSKSGPHSEASKEMLRRLHWLNLDTALNLNIVQEP